MRLQGRTALVTGATAGIGQAIALAFAHEGAHVVVTGRDTQRGQAVVEAIHAADGSARFVAADLTSPAGIERLAKEAAEAFGPTDILVNNAGIFPFGPTARTDEATFDAVIRTNVKAPYYLTASLAPQMAARVGKDHQYHDDGRPCGHRWVCALWRIQGGADAAHQVLGGRVWPERSQCQCHSPGPMRTPEAAEMGEELDQIASTLPAGRLADPSEIAEAAVYLASPEANFVHGITLPVDGGRAAI